MPLSHFPIFFHLAQVLFFTVINNCNGEEVIHFDLMEEFSIETALVVCEIYRYNGDWKFNAVAAGYQGGLEALCRAYGVNV